MVCPSARLVSSSVVTGRNTETLLAFRWCALALTAAVPHSNLFTNDRLSLPDIALCEELLVLCKVTCWKISAKKRGAAPQSAVARGAWTVSQRVHHNSHTACHYLARLSYGSFWNLDSSLRRHKQGKPANGPLGIPWRTDEHHAQHPDRPLAKVADIYLSKFIQKWKIRPYNHNQEYVRSCEGCRVYLAFLCTSLCAARVQLARPLLHGPLQSCRRVVRETLSAFRKTPRNEFFLRVLQDSGAKLKWQGNHLNGCGTKKSMVLCVCQAECSKKWVLYALRPEGLGE